MRLYSTLVVLCSTTLLAATQVAIVGCGYVGLTLAAVLADAGHSITCVDIDEGRIKSLEQRQLPIYEPGLYDLLFNSGEKNNIFFTASFDDIAHHDIYYVCVPTPVDAQGACDCSCVRTACASIIALQHHRDKPPIIVIKSTVVPGTIRLLKDEFSASACAVHFVYNPEFMREGCALHDIRSRNPIVLGAESEEALQCIEQILATCLCAPTGIIKTNFETAELIKYAWNAFSAMRIAYVNELAFICRSLGANVLSVVHGLALSEQLLPTHQLKPGPGYGGSCLPKDTTAFAHMLTHIGLDNSITHRTLESNRHHKHRVLQDILASLGPIPEKKTVTLLGLSFKANTNDIRHSVALDIIPALLEYGVVVKAYDPQAMHAMQALYQDVVYCTSVRDAVIDTDCIVVLTEWQEFRELDLGVLASLCNRKNIIDTRNLFSPTELNSHGFDYITMGIL